ncbi:MAG: hypothetical protein HY040_26960 [Planctomycetes bacterium]|nr:hypothetical protein [Planctomycetota bacterium]
MIRHHTIGQETYRVLLEGFDHDALEGFVVAMFLKEGQSGHATIERVIDITPGATRG